MDCQGTLRGACTVCDCRIFVSGKGIRCDYCDDPAAKHQNLSSPPPNPLVTSWQTEDDGFEAVVTDGECEGDNDDDEDGLQPVMPDETLRSAFPSTTMLGYGYYATPAPALQTYNPLAAMIIPQPQQAQLLQQPPLPADRRCSMPGCTRPKFVETATGRIHDYCGKRHATEHRRSLPATGAVPPHLKCSTPGCNRQRRSMPDGSGYYDYCSLSCRNDGGGGFGSQEVLSSDQICSLSGCTRPRFVDPSSDMSVGLQQLTSRDYALIALKFRNDWAAKKGPCPSVDHIFQVSSKNQDKKWKCYRDALTSGGHPTDVEQHYHGTTIKCDLISSKSFCSHNDCGICGISRNGFQKLRIGSNITFKRFGHGFYLAPHSSKCHDYTQGTHTHRAMLLCDVLPGKKHIVQTDQTHLVAPPQGYDSVYGQPGGSLNYPEIVIYDEASILPRYVIIYQKDGVGKIA
ncbi:hypothetical protein EMCRGX_G002404 [Ephydatia muelleri]